MRLRRGPAQHTVDRWDDGELAAFAASIGGALAIAPAADPRATATRAAVLGAFAARGLAPAPARPARPARSRAWLALPLAGALVAAGALGVMASSAGQPLYGARLALEEVALPASGAARETAQLDRLDARIREVVAAHQAADDPALRASLDAFAGIADEAARQAAPDPGDASRVRAHIAALERLQLTGDAEAARIRALTAARGLLGALLVAPGAGAPSDLPGIGPGPGSGGGASGAAPNPTPSPRASARSRGTAPSASGGPTGADPAGPGPSNGDGEQPGNRSKGGSSSGGDSGGESSGGDSGGSSSGGAGGSSGGGSGPGGSSGDSGSGDGGSGGGQGAGR